MCFETCTINIIMITTHNHDDHKWPATGYLLVVVMVTGFVKKFVTSLVTVIVISLYLRMGMKAMSVVMDRGNPWVQNGSSIPLPMKTHTCDGGYSYPWQRVGVIHRSDGCRFSMELTPRFIRRKYPIVFKYNSTASVGHQVVVHLGVYSMHKYNVGGGDPWIWQVGVFHRTDTMIHKKKSIHCL